MGWLLHMMPRQACRAECVPANPSINMQLRKEGIGMTEEAQGKGKLNAAQAISIGFIEKAWEFKWGIQLIYIALYADAVLAWFLHRNLLSVTATVLLCFQYPVGY